MRLAILGGTSQIAKDLILSLSRQGNYVLVLYARRPEVLTQWLACVGLGGRNTVFDFGAFNADEHFDAILNFVGVGDPAQAVAMGSSIFDVTLKYDDMALDYLRMHPDCRYLFMSSGAAYGSNFEAPADEKTKSIIAINSLQPQDWYAVAKLHAECRHRSQPQLPIVDIRVFNYFSHTQDMSARFLITDIVRAIQDKTIFQTSSDYIVRDYLHPSDFCELVCALLCSPAQNTVVDCYTKAPIDKPALLAGLQERFGLQYKTTQANVSVNATGSKAHYYSLNTRAADFGYQPTFTAFEGVVKEMQTILQEAERGHIENE